MMLFNRPNHQSRRASISDDQSDRGGALDQRTPDGVTRHRRLSFNDSVADGVPPRPPQSPPTPSTTGPTIQTLQQQLKKATADGDKQAIQLQKGIMRKKHSWGPDAPLSVTSAHLTAEGRHDMIKSLLAAKEATGKSFTHIGQDLGLTNTFAAQLFYNQAQLRPGRVAALRRAVPGLSDAQIAFMMRSPMRCPESSALQEPSHRVLQEALAHHAAAIKAIMNEEWGDVVLNPAEVGAEVSLTPGKNGEQRFTLTLTGKFTPFAEHEVYVANGLTSHAAPEQPTHDWSSHDRLPNGISRGLSPSIEE